jgi:hypothetical protein
MLSFKMKKDLLTVPLIIQDLQKPLERQRQTSLATETDTTSLSSEKLSILGEFFLKIYLKVDIYEH